VGIEDHADLGRFMLALTATAFADALSTALPIVFVLGSAALVARYLRADLRLSSWTLGVIALAVGIGVFWGYVALAFASLSVHRVSPSEAGLTIATSILFTLAGALVAWAIVTRSSRTKLPALIGAVLVAAVTAPALVWSSYGIASAGREADERATVAAAEREISDRSTPMSLIVREAVVTLAGPVPTLGPGAPGVEGRLRLRVDLQSTSQFSVHPGSPFISTEVRRPGFVQALASFSQDVPPLPSVIPVGTTPLDLDLDGGVVAGSDIGSDSAVWTLALMFNWSQPGTGYLVKTTFRPTFAP
jgi:hypothetical protein